MSALAGLTSDQLAEVLVVSDLPTGSHPTPAKLDQAVESTIHRFHGVAGCLGVLAEIYGNDWAAVDARLPWAHDEAFRLAQAVAA